MKIVLAEYPQSSTRDFYVEQEVFRKEELVVAVYEEDKRDQFMEICKDADGILTGYVKFDREMILGLEKCKVISVQATGWNYVDVEAAREKGIAVCAIGEYCTQEVADHACMMMLALLKGLKIYDRSVQQERQWIYNAAPGLQRIAGLSLGIVGFGKIGRAVAERMRSFGMKILAYDPFLPKEMIEQHQAEPVTMETLLECSDVISIHMNLTKDNEGMFGMETFRKMKKKPFLINVARGGAIEENALCTALDQGLIRGAGLDVLASETPDLCNHPLLGRDNVIITPHSAFYSDVTEYLLYRIPADNVKCCLEGRYQEANRVVNQVGI